MRQLAALWAEGFRKLHPNVMITIDCSGSEIALPELTQQTSTAPAGKPQKQNVIGLVSRPLTAAEADPTAGQSQRTPSTLPNQSTMSTLLTVIVCRDPVAVIVHPTNPIESLVWDPRDQVLLSSDFQTLQSCLSTSGTWGAVGIGEAWSDKTITVCAPPTGHGTRTVLSQWFYGETLNDDAAATTTPQQSKVKLFEYADRAELIKAVEAEPTAIGLASLSLGGLEAVKQIPISIIGQAPIAPTQDAIDEETYPLIRPLYLVVDQNAATKEGTLEQEFIRYVLSDFGQTDVIKDGFIPLTRSDLLMQTEKLSGEIVR